MKQSMRPDEMLPQMKALLFTAGLLSAMFYLLGSLS
jgi:hypothetical protein